MQASITRAARSHPIRDYLLSHWRGEQSLAWSYWVNNGLLAVPLALGLTGLMAWISHIGDSLQLSAIVLLVGWPLVLALDVWCIVGAWRAAREYRHLGGSALWTLLARISLVLGALQTLASLSFGLAPQLGDYWKMARGIDPIGQASFAVSPEGHKLSLSGPIGLGDASRLKALLAEHPGIKRIELASPGGRLREAERMVTLLRERGANTRAVGDCESACTLVFLAGAQRQLMPGAQLGFHRASSGTANPVFDELANEHLSRTYRRMELPEYFITRTLKTPAHRMWYPGSEELISHALIERPPLTLDVPLPALGGEGQVAALTDYREALLAHPAWYQLEQRFPGLLNAAAQQIRLAHRPGEEALAQQAALQVLAPHLQELILGSPAEQRRRYVAVLRQQLRAAQALGPARCQAWLSGDLPTRRELPGEVLAQETRWLTAAAQEAPPRRMPGLPSPIELEVMHRTLGAQAPGLLNALWSGGAPDRRLPGCERAAQLIDQAGRLPAAQRELAERVVFQQLR
jgi:hypothetical protein